MSELWWDGSLSVKSLFWWFTFRQVTSLMVDIARLHWSLPRFEAAPPSCQQTAHKLSPSSSFAFSSSSFCGGSSSTEQVGGCSPFTSPSLQTLSPSAHTLNSSPAPCSLPHNLNTNRATRVGIGERKLRVTASLKFSTTSYWRHKLALCYNLTWISLEVHRARWLFGIICSPFTGFALLSRWDETVCKLRNYVTAT